jgi:hypothetical protein
VILDSIFLDLSGQFDLLPSNYKAVYVEIV